MSVRLFVALELPPSARAALAAWRDGVLRSVGGLRPVDPQALHCTLCFLGSRPEEEVPSIAAALRVSGSVDVFSLAFGEPLWLPRGRPRVLAVSLADPGGALTRLQGAVSSALVTGGWYAREARPFMPHVTVARVRGDARARPAELPAVDGEEFRTERVTLFRSRLGAGPARYETLASVQLGSGPGGVDADPVSVVRSFHALQARAYAHGELEPLRDLLTDDVVWHVPGRSEISGDHAGIDAVLSYFARRRELTDATFRMTIHGEALIGDRVVQLADGHARRDGREALWQTVGVFRVAEGRIAECWLLPFDQDAFDRVWG